MMAPYKAAKGIPRKPMRVQLRGDRRNLKPVKTEQKRNNFYGRK